MSAETVTANNIIKNENDRLIKKKQSVDNVLTSKERMIQLNTNYIERKAQYQKMLIAVIIGLAVCIAVYIINKFIVIPDVIFSLILIITIVGIAIYCFSIYIIIVNRDPMDFNKINKPPPATLTPIEITKAKEANLAGSSNGSADLLGILTGACSGSECCSKTSKWDVDTQLCISSTDTFQTLFNNEPVFKVVNQNINTKFFTPFEFDQYSIY